MKNLTDSDFQTFDHSVSQELQCLEYHLELFVLSALWLEHFYLKNHHTGHAWKWNFGFWNSDTLQLQLASLQLELQEII